MSKQNEDERKFVLRNTSGKRIIWDRQEGPIDTVRFVPDGEVCLTESQMQARGSVPRGVIVEEFQPGTKHDPKKGRIG